MFLPPRPSSPRQRSASCSIDDQSTKDGPRRLFQRGFHDLSMSSQSLASTGYHHDDLPIPSLPAHAPRTSAQSTPMTSPSTGYSSLFPGSLSSATSESVPSADSRIWSEFGVLVPGPSSAIHGSSSSGSFARTWSQSPTESDPQSSAPRIPRKHPSDHFSNRPMTAPNSPLVFAVNAPDRNPSDHHARSHSRITVSIKNMFSRHAVPSPSRLSFNSAASTPPRSETSSNSFQVPVAAGKWSMTPRKTRPPDLEISGSVAPAIPSPGRASNSIIDVHRRYASEAAAKISNTRTGNGGPASQENVDVLPRNVPPVRARDPKTRNVLRRRPSGSAKLLKGRDRSPSRPNDGNAARPHLPPKEGTSRQGGASFPLTPAGAVVEAYKQQELRRDETPSPPKLSIDDRMSSTASHDGRHERDRLEHSPMPYYTVLGSERRVPACGPDDRWHKFEVDDRIFTSSQPTLSHQPSMSDPGARALTRKLSNRWRRAKGGGVVAEDSPSRDKGHMKGRPSLQDPWASDKLTLRPTGRSMDGVSNPADGAWASPSASHARSASKGDKNEGPKLWRLMRRISTGGLKDRFQADKAVPPVPAIPKELLTKMNHSERSDDPLSPSRHQPSLSLHDKDQTRPSLPTAPRNIPVARPSMATSSSSPNSSDVASTQFFRKSHSPRSSVSSYGEAVVIPRPPEPMLTRHIIAPLEQLRLADDHAGSGEATPSCLPKPRSPRRSTSVPVGLRSVENAEGDHLPLPSPRRQTCSGSPSGSSRPCSTSLSPCGSSRASYQNPPCGQSRMADGTVSLSPPPRPSAKSSPRGGAPSVTGSPSQSMVVKQVDGGVEIGIGAVRQIDRMPSGRSDMTARVDSPEPARDQDPSKDASPRVRRKLTFRQLDAPRKPPLSEREKTDIWNNLLAQSDEAGGTLHINGAAELMSDSMRLSMLSEL